MTGNVTVESAESDDVQPDAAHAVSTAWNRLLAVLEVPVLLRSLFSGSKWAPKPWERGATSGIGSQQEKSRER